jgi:hypothetical protein
MAAAIIEPLLGLATRMVGGEAAGAAAGAAEAGGASTLGKTAASIGSLSGPSNSSGSQGRRSSFDQGVAEPIRPV